MKTYDVDEFVYEMRLLLDRFQQHVVENSDEPVVDYFDGWFDEFLHWYETHL